MAAALAEHDATIEAAVVAHGGSLIKTKGEGDSTFSVFDEPAAALATALAAQQGLARGTLRVRMAMHTGPAETRSGDYYGPTVNRCARLRAATHGGQVVLSHVVAQLVHGHLPPGATLRDLGVHRLRDLAEPEHVFQLCHADLASEFPPLASLDQRHDNLRAPLTTFVGRHAELSDLTDVLGDARLVTLVGAGGAGKTRIALEVARRLLDRFADGVWLAELSAIEESAQVERAVATVLGIREEPGRPLAQALTGQLSCKSVLLLLDNCEHVIEAAAAITERVLNASDRTVVLATSRQALGLAGERVWRVHPLSVPEDVAFDTAEAVQLFVDRARRTDPHFELDAVGRDAVARICRAVDGLPLAVELAAARLDALSLTQIAERLGKQFDDEAGDRFDLLTSSSRDAEPRQRTLAAAIGWSYNLLDGAERDGFAALAMFPSTFDLGAAEAVLGRRALDIVSALVAKSLLARVDERYSMLETVRAYAAERLAGSGRTGEVHDRAVGWARAVASTTDLDLLDAERDNLSAALHWAAARRPSDALAIADGLGRLWEHRGYWSEGRAVLDDVLRRVGNDDPAGRARALHTAGRLAFGQGDFAEAESLQRESLAIGEDVDDDQIVQQALTELGGLAHTRGDIADARLHFDAALTISRARSDRKAEAGALGNLGILAHAAGDLERARWLYDEAIAIARTLSDDLFLSSVLGNAAMVLESCGEIDAATAMYGEALTLARRQGSPVATATVLTRLGPLAVKRGDMDEAQATLAEALELFRELGDRANVANVLYRLGDLANREKKFDKARKLLEESLDLWRELGHALGEAALLLSVGELDRVAGEDENALNQFKQSLRVLHRLRSLEGIAEALDLIAAVAAHRGDDADAAELVAAADAIRDRMGAARPSASERAVDLAALVRVLGSSYAATAARGSSLSVDDAVAHALDYGR